MTITEDEWKQCTEQDKIIYDEATSGLPQYHGFRGDGFDKFGERIPFGSGAHILKHFRNAIEIVKPKKILEIGFNIGTGSSMILALCDAELTSMDVSLKDETIAAANLLEDKYKGRFKYFNRSEFVPSSDYELCFVDGGHDEENVTKDIEFCLSMKIPYLLFDDIYENYGPGVMPSIDKFGELELISDMLNLRLYKVHYSEKIDKIKLAIGNAINNSSKINNDVLALQSFSSPKNRHLFNNLGAISHKYLECGFHKAGLFISTLFGNNLKGIGVDNFSQFEEGGIARQMAYENLNRLLPKEQYTIYEQDIFSITTKQVSGVDMYLYDGNHAFEFQRDGLLKFLPMMKDEFIFICDDFGWKDPSEGTYAAIKEAKLEVLYKKVLWDGKEWGEWHNGLGVFLLKKTTKK